MPRSALPSHLNEDHEIDAAFPDDSQFGTTSWFGRFYRWINKETKTWFVFSYRATEWWAKWRKVPKVLFAVKGRGLWRFEGIESVLANRILFFLGHDSSYLSRVQYHCRWHFAVQWPLMLSFHWYPNAGDVPGWIPGHRPDSKSLKGKVWFGYLNHFDSDLVYWMLTSAYLGRNWK